MSKSKQIIKFLKSHPLINVRGLEKKLKIPDTTLCNSIKGRRNIPKKYLFWISKELEQYGFYLTNSDEL